jgi:hypothetical protein
MGFFRFQPRVRLLGGLVRLIASKSGLSISAGPRWLSFNTPLIDSSTRKRKPQVTVGLPGTGLSYRQMIGRAGNSAGHNNIKGPCKIKFNTDDKFDLQLSQALINERNLANIFEHLRIEKIELKSETWQWEQIGNICIEYEQNGRPSGIAVTEADYWVHELKRGGQTLVYLMFPVERLKELARRAYAEGRYREGGGDHGRFKNVLIPLSEILKPAPVGQSESQSQTRMVRIKDATTDEPATPPPSEPSFRAVGSAAPDEACLVCYQTGMVFRITDGSAGANVEPLHKGCAPAWFQKVGRTARHR